MCESAANLEPTTINCTPDLGHASNAQTAKPTNDAHETKAISNIDTHTRLQPHPHRVITITPLITGKIKFHLLAACAMLEPTR